MLLSLLYLLFPTCLLAALPSSCPALLRFDDDAERWRRDTRDGTVETGHAETACDLTEGAKAVVVVVACYTVLSGVRVLFFSECSCEDGMRAQGRLVRLADSWVDRH